MAILVQLYEYLIDSAKVPPPANIINDRSSPAGALVVAMALRGRRRQGSQRHSGPGWGARGAACTSHMGVVKQPASIFLLEH
eukprot:COSAG01_NODE_42344_length_441_cov_0.602339_1_plen_81_part_10